MFFSRYFNSLVIFVPDSYSTLFLVLCGRIECGKSFGCCVAVRFCSSYIQDRDARSKNHKQLNLRVIFSKSFHSVTIDDNDGRSERAFVERRTG